MRYYEMNHSNGTRMPITQTEFNKRLKDYKFYDYDPWIKCYRYIIKYMDSEFEKPTWLLIEDENK